MNTSDTPIIDAKVKYLAAYMLPFRYEYMTEYARDLERENAALRDALVQAGVTEKRLKEHSDRVNNANDRLIVEILPLYEDKARLDWLAVSDAWFDTPADEAFTPQSFRAAIDALRKEAQP